MKRYQNNFGEDRAYGFIVDFYKRKDFVVTLKEIYNTDDKECYYRVYVYEILWAVKK